MNNYFKRYLTDESGATAVEYGLLVSLMGVGLIAGAFELGGKIDDALGGIGIVLTDATLS